ncbi:RNA methyltransferase tRNA(m5U54)methyltransferase [Monascus purpureus]|uniref:RNA methyltransferase tRNA(M5U54)methyltransferase n=1 Tax=Monascus purpureus TaxID=5098 RepID=A0A507R3B1_MONPU|nr:RNA methyltransferase tRNA(m5U54)methyltransferase [Monascus purpureus]
MDPSQQDALSKPGSTDTRPLGFMQRLDPSPVQDPVFDPETGEYQPETRDPNPSQRNIAPSRVSVAVSAVQKYSTYPPTLFFALHFANTSLIPLVTRSVSASEPYLLLTRPAYQSPGFEHVALTVPILIHVAAGVVLRNIRASRRARLYGAETRAQRSLLKFWPKMSLQTRLGYLLVPLLGSHVLVNRIVPLIVEGGSSGVGLGYVAHGFARNPTLWNIYYTVFVAAGVWHIAGGWATWLGWRITTARKEGGRSKGTLGGYLAYRESEQVVRKRRRMWWVVNGVAAVGTSLWLAGALGIIGLGGPGSPWEAKNWSAIYRQIPIIGDCL